MSRFFIDRPIFAAVLSIVITLAGGIAVFTLSVSQYPDITPPTVQVTALYPGANAQLVVDTVAAPIEQQVNGVENMMYMSSQSTNDGAYILTVTFKLGSDLNMAQVLVQNRVSLAEPVIPDIVQREGISVKKKSPSIMMIVNLTSPDGRYNDVYLSNYATIQLRDELLRLPGVGDVTYLGERDYSMRVWLNPDKLQSYNLSAEEVVEAIEQQNIQVAAGQIGQQPAPAGQLFQLSMSALGRLTDVEQFEDIIIKAEQSKKDGTASKIVRLRDVGSLDLGSQQYDQACTLDGKPSVALSIYQLPGSNAMATAKSVYKKMHELKQRFPEGLEYSIVYDTTPFIWESIVEVLKTLRDAIILVAIVVLLFLQSWRATLIPLIAVPVAIIGTFAIMAAMGFSLNNLSLFGLVLAIGIVVDDAIVVVENVERWLEQGLSPRDASAKAMDEVTGPVVAVALVLCAVFVPCAFISGITGQFFRQFALTIAVSTVISAFNSLTLSPALAALLLRKHGQSHDPLTWLLNVSLGWLFKGFNRSFDFATNIYAKMVGGLLRVSAIVLLIYGGLLYLTYWGFTTTPSGFIPEQDKGYLLVNVQLPDSASVQRTEAVMKRVEEIARKMDGVAHTVGVSGASILANANASNFGSMYVMLEEFSHRRGHALSGPAIADKLHQRCAEEIQDALVSVFGAPPVDGLGSVGGFKLQIQDRESQGVATLQATVDEIIAKAQSRPELADLFTVFRANAPQLYLDIDRTKCMSLGVPMTSVFDTLQVFLGSLYVNNFNRFGRTWQVNVQADPEFRFRASEVSQYKVKNESGDMVPLGTLLNIRDVGGPVLLMRYNMYPSASINGNNAPGTSSGQAIDLMNSLCNENLNRTMSFTWTELTYMQILAGNTAMIVFALAVVLVFLVLAAQYESWSLPLAVILVVPMCLLCSIAGVAYSGLDVNIFTQIGFIVLVGLASKNAILIVEFAKAQRETGVDRRTATVEACRLRLRPIMMTSLAFILGVVPLVIAEGAGAEMRRTLGIAVFSGMIGVTLFGIYLTPVFFFVIDWFASRREPSSLAPPPAVSPPADRHS